MLNNKLSVAALAGAVALLGGIGGTALMASAQTATTLTPAAITNQNTAQTVNTPESSNDQADTPSAVDAPESSGKADTDGIQSGTQQVGDHQDSDGNAATEASEPAGSSDTSEQ